jgi:hypothetical protein
MRTALSTSLTGAGRARAKPDLQRLLRLLGADLCRPIHDLSVDPAGHAHGARTRLRAFRFPPSPSRARCPPFAGFDAAVDSSQFQVNAPMIFK